MAYPSKGSLLIDRSALMLFTLSLLLARIHEIHEKYGDKVRLAPNEVSVATGAAWQDIHGLRGENRAMLKNPIWWSEIPGRAPSIVSSLDLETHERTRKVLDHCFSTKALKDHEPTIQYYPGLMLHKLREQMGSNRTTIVNIVDWYMFLTFDILGDLGFGESFSCLEMSIYYSWLRTLFNYFKMAAFVGSLRIYFTMSIDSVLVRCLPKHMKHVSENHYQWAVDKVHQRMNLENQRNDFMTHIPRHNKGDGMTIAEIENNSNVLVVAGSETRGTVLSGTTNYLLKNPEVYRKFSREIRSAFSREEDMTFASLRELPYLNAVVSEGLRLCPPSSSGLSHVVPPPGETVCGGWLPGGTVVSVHQWSLYRSSSKFYRPNDFVPDRWLLEIKCDPSSPLFYDDLSAVQAFSVGIWSCPGKQHAYDELRVVLGRMVWNFELSVAAGGRDVDWTKQKCWFLVEKEPFDIKLADIRWAVRRLTE